MGRRMNDGFMTGLKQDRYRHSRFEVENEGETSPREEMSHQDLNTIGGAWEENRGRRSAREGGDRRFDSPFENLKLRNWNHRQGWGPYYSKKSYREGRHGGGWIGNDHEDHTGRGPKGYSRPDKSIYEDVCEALTMSPDVDASSIEVEVKEGCVYLKGTVPTRSTKRMAELEIENISGVRDVQNLLKFPTNPGEKNVH